MSEIKSINQTPVASECKHEYPDGDIKYPCCLCGKIEKTTTEEIIKDSQPKEVVAPVDIDEILNEYFTDTMRGTPRVELERILRKHLKGTTPVEPINQERLREIKEKYQLRLERNRKERDKTSIEGVSEILTKEFVEDLQSLQSESEVVQGEVEIKFNDDELATIVNRIDAAINEYGDDDEAQKISDNIFHYLKKKGYYD